MQELHFPSSACVKAIVVQRKSLGAVWGWAVAEILSAACPPRLALVTRLES